VDESFVSISIVPVVAARASAFMERGIPVGKLIVVRASDPSQVHGRVFSRLALTTGFQRPSA
jgi:hypothetical protein